MRPGISKETKLLFAGNEWAQRWNIMQMGSFILNFLIEELLRKKGKQFLTIPGTQHGFVRTSFTILQ